MTISYSLKDGKVEETIDTPAKEEKLELGKKEDVIKQLEEKMANYQNTIDAVTEQKTTTQAKLTIIKALK